VPQLDLTQVEERRRLLAEVLAHGTNAEKRAFARQFDGSELAKVGQRKADIEATIDDLLDNITPTNRDYGRKRIA